MQIVDVENDVSTFSTYQENHYEEKNKSSNISYFSHFYDGTWVSLKSGEWLSMYSGKLHSSVF